MLGMGEVLDTVSGDDSAVMIFSCDLVGESFQVIPRGTMAESSVASALGTLNWLEDTLQAPAVPERVKVRLTTTWMWVYVPSVTLSKLA
jgi:predicted molibdopterin-dependent oxidoreductase YjgC